MSAVSCRVTLNFSRFIWSTASRYNSPYTVAELAIHDRPVVKRGDLVIVRFQVLWRFADRIIETPDGVGKNRASILSQS